MAIYLKINDNERIEIKPTIFPDKTSQVWKVPGIDTLLSGDKVYIYWLFEEEAEIIWVLQLCDLIHSKVSWYHLKTSFIIPYFPYARQDKDVSNNASFALCSFDKIIDFIADYNSTIYCLDIHNEGRLFFKIKANLVNHIPVEQIKAVISNYDIMLLPDHGAFERYRSLNSFQSTYCVKIRNQLTGHIESITIPNADFKDKRVLIVDDICDGGGTFIEIAKQLKEKGASRIGLHVSHGIFSKGMDILHAAGINEIHCLSYEDFYQKVIDGEIK